MDPTVNEFLASWDLRADVLFVAAALAVAYVTGWRRLRQRRPGAVRFGSLAFYLIGLAAVVLALVSPIDAFATSLFTLHVIEHELLTMVAPPLLLLANPFPVVFWAVSQGLRHRLGRLLTRRALLRRAIRALTWMPVAWLIYMVILWGWHLPSFFEMSLRNEFAHDVQHLSFFLAGLLYWWPLVNPAPRLHGHIPYGFRLVYIIAAVGPIMLPTMSIALFARQVFYPYYAAVPRLWGLTALEDQAIGWALMGLLDGLIYFSAFLVLVARMLDYEERMTCLRESLGYRPGSCPET